MIFYKQFKNVFGMFYVCITGHLACIRASADSQRPMLKGLSRKPGRQLWISWPKGNCPGKCIFRTQLRMQKLLFIGLDWKAKQKTNSPCFFLFLCSAWLRLRTSLNYLWPVVSGVVVNSAQAVRHFVPPARVGSFDHFNGSSMPVVVLKVRKLVESRAAWSVLWR